MAAITCTSCSLIDRPLCACLWTMPTTFSFLPSLSHLQFQAGLCNRFPALAFLWGSPSTVHSFRGIKLDTISLLTKSLHTTTNVSLNIRQNSWPPPSCCCPFLHLLIDFDGKNSLCCFIHISCIARADLLWSSFAPWLELLLASLFLLACLTCQTFKCVLMLQELPHLEPILMAFGLPSNCLRALFIQNFILLS